ncbi:MAG: Ig-like domain-containing protein [Bacteroidaceae bacterium]|nr:Ig-like domain-containing protein [Bacteroidaceae bacterium]
MKKIFTLLFALTAISTVMAQMPLPVPDGFYRTRNKTTGRYVTVIDDYGRVDYTSTSADMGAIRTFRTNDSKPNWNEQKIFSNPGSIIYSTHNSSGYNFQCQGTTTYQILGVYLNLNNRNNAYQLYASKSGQVLYLHDMENFKDSSNVTSGSTSGAYTCYKDWEVLPVSTDGDNYFGMLPTITNKGAYYLSFFASFPFSFHSAGMNAYYINKVDASLKVAVIKEIGANKSDIPAGMPIIVKCSSDKPTNNRLNIHVSSAKAPSDNMLKGVYFCRKERQATNQHNDYVENDPNTMRVIGVLSDGSIGMKKYGGLYIPQNTAYLQVPVGTPDELKLVTEEEYQKMTDVKVTSISLNKTEISKIEVGEQVQLTATVLPTNATNRNVTWSSSNSKVATVDANGLVTIVGEGEAIITAKTTDGSNLSATCKITVPHVEVLLGDANADGVVDVSDITAIASFILGRQPAVFIKQNADANQDGYIDVSDITFVTSIILGSNVLLGDANNDKVVDVSDITTIASYILGKNPNPFNAKNADANKDGVVDVSDITATVGIILH